MSDDDVRPVEERGNQRGGAGARAGAGLLRLSPFNVAQVPLAAAVRCSVPARLGLV